MKIIFIVTLLLHYYYIILALLLAFYGESLLEMIFIKQILKSSENIRHFFSKVLKRCIVN